MENVSVICLHKVVTNVLFSFPLARLRLGPKSTLLGLGKDYHLS